MNEFDICDSCTFCDACPSAHFHPYEKTANICAFYKNMKTGVEDGIFWRKMENDD